MLKLIYIRLRLRENAQKHMSKCEVIKDKPFKEKMTYIKTAKIILFEPGPLTIAECRKKIKK